MPTVFLKCAVGIFVYGVLSVKQRPLYFKDTLDVPLVVDANCVVLVQQATKPPLKEGEPSPGIEPGVVALFLTHAPGRLFVKGDFDAVALNIFGVV